MVCLTSLNRTKQTEQSRGFKYCILFEITDVHEVNGIDINLQSLRLFNQTPLWMAYIWHKSITPMYQLMKQHWSWKSSWELHFNYSWPFTMKSFTTRHNAIYKKEPIYCLLNMVNMDGFNAKNLTPLLIHWSYFFIALTHRHYPHNDLTVPSPMVWCYMDTDEPVLINQFSL